MKKQAFEKHNICIVTGAAGGMGQEFCKALLNRGCKVIGTDIDTEKLQDLNKTFKAQALSKNFSYISLDITNPKAVQQSFEELLKTHGRIDCLINNAGIMSSAPFEDYDLGNWKKVIDINLMGLIYCSHYAYQTMKKQGHGRIINVSSTAGITPVLMSTAYAASKHAVVGFTHSLRGEAKGSGINIHLVIPGLIDTEIFDRALDDVKSSSRHMADLVPIKKLPAHKAVSMIFAGVDKDKQEIIFPILNKIIVKAYRLFPNFMGKLIMSNQKF